MTVGEQQGLETLLESWINGNRTWVREQLKKRRRELSMWFVLMVLDAKGREDAEKLIEKMP